MAAEFWPLNLAEISAVKLGGIAAEMNDGGILVVKFDGKFGR